MKLFFYVPTMSQYILNVMVADYCIIFSANVLQIWFACMEILFFSKYFQKIHQIHKPGSRTPGFVQMNLKMRQSTIFHTDYCAKWKCAVE